MVWCFNLSLTYIYTVLVLLEVNGPVVEKGHLFLWHNCDIAEKNLNKKMLILVITFKD